MMDEQKVPALLAALIGEGVRADQIERAVAVVRDAPLGRPLSALADASGQGRDQPMVRAFVFEQTRLLERG